MVHAYGFRTAEYLGALTLAVCWKIVKHADDYDQIILLGGWDTKGKPAIPTSAQLMELWLIEHGVPSEKLVTQFSAGELSRTRMPARDTIEEADLAGAILRALYPDESPPAISFDAVGAWFHALRIKMIWWKRTPRLNRFLRVFSWRMFMPDMWWRIIQEIPGYFLVLNDPLGTGNFFRHLRRGRTHDHDHITSTCLPNTIEAWHPERFRREGRTLPMSSITPK